MIPSVAVLPGSFDPPTNGHIDIIRRASSLFEKLYVVIGVNKSKKHLFQPEEICGMLRETLEDKKNVEVSVWDGLIVDFAKKHNAGVILRGVRPLADFSYEFELAETNMKICPEIEVVFLPASSEYFFTRSSSIREMISFGVDISALVPPAVVRAVKMQKNCQLR
ncbi:MAG: pantetheine-phosphate adenylyltransferase [Sphaerochaetaceae bacterium]|nr:pantetheine-phosphate adenylyltransferase [Sphaerochaetaceae bacterium]